MSTIVNAAPDASRPLVHLPAGTLPVVAVVTSYLTTDDWLVAFALAVLLAGWRLLRPQRGTPVLAVAFTYQWMQAASGMFYFHLTGRQLTPMREVDWRPEVVVALVALLALAAGLHAGVRLVRGERARGMRESALTSRQLLIIYVLATLTSYMFLELTTSFEAFEGLYQGAVFFAFARIAVLYLVFRRLLQPPVHLGLFAVLVLFEISIGITGYFASFREVIVVAALAVLEVFDTRRLSHWMICAVLGSALVVTGLAWTGIKSEYRAAYDADAALSTSRSEKLDLVGRLASRWLAQGSAAVAATTDAAFDRLWQVYYPALALHRVPRRVAHSNGAFLWNAIVHVLTPRFFFEDKSALLSDSDKVRRYAGVNVAGAERNTSIAFGYVAESYVDFGLPFMYLPIFLWGMVAGLAYQWGWRLFVHRDVATGALSTVFWLGLYLFERSWDRSLGVSITTALFVGGAALVLDRLLVELEAMNARAGAARTG